MGTKKIYIDPIWERLDAFEQLLEKYPPDDKTAECYVNGYKVSLWIRNKIHTHVRDANNMVVFEAHDDDPSVIESKLEAFLKSKNIQV